MKKLISVILALSMLLSLTACGTDYFYGEKITASIKGSGSKTMTLSLSGEFGDNFKRIVSTEQRAEDSESFIDCSASKTEQGKYVYKITGLAEGVETLIISILDASGEVYATFSTDVSVDAKGKLSYANVDISDKQYFFEYENTVVTESLGRTQTIKLSGEIGSWKLGSYDSAVIEVAAPDIDEDGFFVFEVTAVGKGTTTLQIYCREAAIQYIYTFEVIDDPEYDAENVPPIGSAAPQPPLVLRLIDCCTAPFTYADDPEAQQKSKDIAEEIKEDIGGEIYIPEGAEIEEGNTTNSETGEHGENNDTADMTMRLNGKLLDYYVTKSIGINAAIREWAENVNATDRQEDYQIDGKTVRYYYMAYGYSVAIWEDNGFVSRLTFMDQEQKDSENVELLFIFLTGKGQ